jgi:hypothetical protein
VLGALLGEWGSDNSSVYYMGGWILSGYVLLGDIRDIAATTVRLDAVGTILNAIALIPLYGDAERTIVIIGKFVLKHADEAGPIVAFALKNIPFSLVDDAIKVLKKAYSPELIDRLVAKGLPPELLLKMYNNGVKLDHLDILIKNIDDKAYMGAWSPGRFNDVGYSIDVHFVKHGDDFDLSGNLADQPGKERYVEMAIDFMKKEDGVELYYDLNHKSIAKYERSTRTFVAGNENGQIVTFFKRDAREIDEHPERFFKIR